LHPYRPATSKNTNCYIPSNHRIDLHLLRTTGGVARIQDIKGGVSWRSAIRRTSISDPPSLSSQRDTNSKTKLSLGILMAFRKLAMGRWLLSRPGNAGNEADYGSEDSTDFLYNNFDILPIFLYCTVLLCLGICSPLYGMSCFVTIMGGESQL
jgi:hypothetical protein